MGETQQPEIIINSPAAVDQPSAATAGGEKSTENRSPPAPEAGAAPPAYQPSATTPPANAQQAPITPAGNDNPTNQGLPASKETQQQQQQPQQLVTPLHALTEAPAWIDCPFCQQRTQTRVARQGDSQQVNCGKQVAMIPHDGMIQVTPVGPSNNGLAPSRYAS
ncbi:hypothetical protein NPX13_g6907 [Xylaria arbuscula]|uniref:LITAF domain-containing protein n=1 Tax=Xylaria arbuscula TaxID=114810 RepID=A0A9W8NAZ4_9PEZI|nr:hypothetical protein NPX13_g6907 [Xylaria arbuscula]